MKESVKAIRSQAIRLAACSRDVQAVVLMTSVLMSVVTTGVSAASVQECLGMGDEEFARAVDDGYEAGVIWATESPCDPGKLSDLEADLGLSLASYAPGAGGRPRASDWKRLTLQVMDRFDGDPHCIYCRRADAPLVCDHVVPVSRGGSNHPLNLVPACERCNSSKGSLLYHEWTAKGRAA